MEVQVRRDGGTYLLSSVAFVMISLFIFEKIVQH